MDLASEHGDFPLNMAIFNIEIVGNKKCLAIETWPFIVVVDLPIEHVDFPITYVAVDQKSSY